MKKWLAAVLVLAAIPLLGLLFADELIRIGHGNVIASPVELPAGAQIREAPRLTRLIGRPIGGASAVTIGRTILVPHLTLRAGHEDPIGFSRDTLRLTPEIWRAIVEHERVHLDQRQRYGRWYLPVYLLWYARRGYQDHPFEVEARTRSRRIQREHRANHRHMFGPSGGYEGQLRVNGDETPISVPAER